VTSGCSPTGDLDRLTSWLARSAKSNHFSASRSKRLLSALEDALFAGSTVSAALSR
jgi:hypothetical protein